jgi:lysyl-tRNA synthetase class 1
MAEKFFWADAIADRIIKEKGDKKEYVCASGITPSGQVHIGNFREVITTELVVRSLREKGKNVKFIYSWDDYDRFRKVPKGLSKKYEKYIGMPVSEVPSPYDNKLSYAEYFEKQFEESLKDVYIEAEFIYQNKMNKKSSYAKLIKIALDNVEKIKSILNKYRKEPLAKSWLPIAVYCDKCKKDFTKIIKIEEYNITYECECGFKETFDFRKKGLVSVKWRVDWALRWKYEDVDFEPGGIDHSVYGGSFTTAKEISREVFDFEPPIYQFYDWISIKGGEAFSSSTGNSMTLREVGEIYEPGVLRYLFVGSKPKSHFNISFDNDVIKIYEDFDQLEKRYFEGNLNPKKKRDYEVSIVDIPKKMPERVGFRHLVTLVQINDLKGLSKYDLKRIEKVKNWLEKYAGEDMKFKVKKKVDGKFNKKEKEALIELKKVLEKNKFKNGKDLFDKFYKICEDSKIDNKDFFNVAYRAIIGKDKGPRLAEFILFVGQEKIAKLLGTIK